MDPITGGGGGGGYSYPDSASSSPRSRSVDSYDEPFPPNSSKVRLMCSYGGRIIPRPTDKSLTYLGGDTRFILLDRHCSLSDLLSKLVSSIKSNTSSSRNADSSSFVLKYQLPNEDLDSLISLSSDEDLDNMIDEYDRINSSASSVAAKSSRIRLFLFPTGKAESATSSSIGSLLDESKSETWFVDALNGTMVVGADTGSGSADLLGLEVRDHAASDRGMTSPDSIGRLETNSSLGSGSSGPVLSNLAPTRVKAEDRPPPLAHDNLDDQFQKMNISSAAKNIQPVCAAWNPMTLAVDNPNLNSNRVGGFNDERPDTRKQQQVLPQQMGNQHQKPPPPVEAPIADSRPVYYQERIPPVQTNPEPKREIPLSDPATTYRMQQVPVSGIHQGPVSGVQQVPGLQQQQPQQQFVHANPQYVPVQSYYQVPHHVQQSQPFDPSVPMYYVPVRPNPQPVSAVGSKPEVQSNLYRPVAAQTQMIHVAAAGAEQGYHLMHRAPAPAQPMANYVYYTQTTTMTPSMPAQYQTVEMKQNRES